MNVSVLESPLGVRWTTLAMGTSIMLVIGVYKRHPWLALAATMGWVTTFEAIFQLTDVLIKHRGLHALLAESWWLWTVIGWSLLAYKSGIWPDWRFTTAFMVVNTVWVLQGYWYNWPGQTTPVNWWFEALNVASKTLLGIGYLVGAWDAVRIWDSVRRTHAQWKSDRAAAAAQRRADDHERLFPVR